MIFFTLSVDLKGLDRFCPDTLSIGTVSFLPFGLFFTYVISNKDNAKPCGLPISTGSCVTVLPGLARL